MSPTHFDAQLPEVGEGADKIAMRTAQPMILQVHRRDIASFCMLVCCRLGDRLRVEVSGTDRGIRLSEDGQAAD
jgi:hypothetical protein